MIQVITEDGEKHICDEVLVGENNMLLVSKDEEITLEMSKVLQIKTITNGEIPDNSPPEVRGNEGPRVFSPL